jgi:hypothetical protein
VRTHTPLTFSRLKDSACVGVLTDNAEGMFASDTVYDDTDAAQLETLDPEQPHRNVDLALIAADKEGWLIRYMTAQMPHLLG